MFSIKKIGILGRTYRHLNRYRQILTILFKYGFGDLIERLNIDRYIEVGLQMILNKKRSLRVEKLSGSERIRMVIEELGPTYIKLGQALSTRSDLIPPEFLPYLYLLQDRVRPCPFEEIKEIIESELKHPIEHVFDFFDKTPIASASIGQVHKAQLKNGEEVAVKVQRPGIKDVIEVDLEIMFHLATLMERHIDEMAVYRPVMIVEEFTRMLEKETDYSVEAASMERFARQFRSDPFIYVPKVFRGTSSERVLTMEFIKGIKISEVSRIDAAGLDRKLINSRGAGCFLQQVFEYGFFHADPHPGNIRVLPNNVICLLDFGMVGSVDRNTREDFVDLLEAMVHRNELKASQIVLKLTSWEDEPDIRLLQREVADFMGRHLYKPLKDIKIGKVLQDLLDLVSRHRLRIPPDIFFVMKAFGTIEGISLLLDPDFDMITEVAPFIEKIKLARFSPGRLTDDALGLLSEMLQFIRQFPRDTLEIARLIRQQKFVLKVEHRGLDPMIRTYEQISSRIAFSVIIAALIIGSALMVVSEIPPLIFGISLIGIVLFILAAVMGLWLLSAILRRGGL